MPNSGFDVYPITKRSGGGFTAGWDFYISNVGVVLVRVHYAVDQVSVLSGMGGFNDDRWHHYALDLDIGTITGRLFIDGGVVGSDAGAGAYDADAAFDCIVNGANAIGSSDGLISMGPIRLSNTRRYVGASFTPAQPPNWPANDANAQLITRMDNGAGVTVTDYSGNGNNGTITFGANTRWYNDPNIRL